MFDRLSVISQEFSSAKGKSNSHLSLLGRNWGTPQGADPPGNEAAIPSTGSAFVRPLKSILRPSAQGPRGASLPRPSAQGPRGASSVRFEATPYRSLAIDTADLRSPLPRPRADAAGPARGRAPSRSPGPTPRRRPRADSAGTAASWALDDDPSFAHYVDQLHLQYSPNTKYTPQNITEDMACKDMLSKEMANWQTVKRWQTVKIWQTIKI